MQSHENLTSLILKYARGIIYKTLKSDPLLLTNKCYPRHSFCLTSYQHHRRRLIICIIIIILTIIISSLLMIASSTSIILTVPVAVSAVFYLHIHLDATMGLSLGQTIVPLEEAAQILTGDLRLQHREEHDQHS